MMLPSPYRQSSEGIALNREESSLSIDELNREDKFLSLIINTKTLASDLRASADEQKNLTSIKGSHELLVNLEEIFSEIEEQSKKLIATIKTSKAVQHNLQSLHDSMLDVRIYFEQLDKTRALFLAKSKLKRRMETLYQTLRVKSTQLMTSVSLELLTLNSLPTQVKMSASSEMFTVAVSFYYGISGRPKNYTLAFEKFIQAAEVGDVDAMVFVSKLYLNGQGVDQNEELALEWLEKAANSEVCPNAKYEIASLIISNLKKKDPAAIRNCFLESSTNSESRQQLKSRESFTMEDSRDANLSYNFEEKNDELRSVTGSEANAATEDHQHASLYYDLQYAVRLLLEASDNGHAEAKTTLGVVYEEIGDIEQAAKWFSLASTGGSARGTYHLGSLFLHGKGVMSTHRHKAFSLLMMAAKNGDVEAQNMIGLCYESGIGTDVNSVAALMHYRLGAEQGSGQAMYNLGYLQVKNGIDLIEHMKRLRPHVRAARFGKAHHKHNSSQEDISYALQSDVLGTNATVASFLLPDQNGEMPEDPYAVLEAKSTEILREGIKWLRAAAEHMIPDAAFQLGRLYEQSVGVPEDSDAALSNYLFAADLGHMKAAFYAANLLYESSHEKHHHKEIETAAMLYRKAADADIPEAMNALAILLEDGRGNFDHEPDFESAAMWFYEACVSGFQPAFLNLAMLLATGHIFSFRTLDDELITIAKAKEFLEKHFKLELAAEDPHSEALSNLLESLDVPDNVSELSYDHNLEPPGPGGRRNRRYSRHNVIRLSSGSLGASSSALPTPLPTPTPANGTEESHSLVLRNSNSPARKGTSSKVDLSRVSILHSSSSKPNSSFSPSKALLSASYDSKSLGTDKHVNFQIPPPPKPTRAKSFSSPDSKAFVGNISVQTKRSFESNSGGVSTQSVHNSNHLLRSGDLYTTNGPIPPPTYVPKAIQPSNPSASIKPAPQRPPKDTTLLRSMKPLTAMSEANGKESISHTNNEKHIEFAQQSNPPVRSATPPLSNALSSHAAGELNGQSTDGFETGSNTSEGQKKRRSIASRLIPKFMQRSPGRRSNTLNTSTESLPTAGDQMQYPPRGRDPNDSRIDTINTTGYSSASELSLSIPELK